MRKALSCVLMMTLLLSGCGAKNDNSPEQLAAVIRGEYLSMTAWSATVDLSAGYGEQVFDFTVDAAWEKEGELVLTVTKPDLLSGITARMRDGETVLEYDGTGLSLGMLDLSGLTPVTALPALMECVTKGYMARCGWSGEGEGKTLVILCRDPNLTEGEGTEYTLYFDPATHALLRAEVSVDGVLRLTAVLSDFTMEMKNDGTGADAHLGGDRPGQSGT